MCMKYVNTIANCYESIELNANNQIVKYINPFDCIYAKADGNRLYIGPFVIGTTINILGTSDEEKKKENPLEQNIKLDFKIRLTKCDPNETNRACLDLETIEIDLSNNDAKHMACFSYATYNMANQISRLYLDDTAGKGKYVIKVLVKRHDEPDDKYSIQSMTKLEVL